MDRRILGLCSLVLAAPIGAIAQHDPIPDAIPLAIEPIDFAFSACGNGAAERTQSRTFKLTPTGQAIVRITDVSVISATQQDWDPARRRLGKVTPAGRMYTVTFQPQAVRASTATLRLRTVVELDAGEGSFDVSIPLTGEGRNCVPPGGDEDGGGGNDEHTGDAPAEPDEEEPKTTICLRFYVVDPVQPVGDEMLRQWLQKANEAFADAGIEFELDGAPVPADAYEPGKDDGHCLDVWIRPNVGDADDHGETAVKTPRTRKWSEVLDDAGFPRGDDGGRGEFAEHMGYGLSIQMEVGGHPELTLAHELGHALGLGGGPPRPPEPDAPEGEDPGSEHLDPDTGEPIDDADTERLMHPRATDCKLTARELEIAGVVAEFLVGTFTTCKHAMHFVEDGIGQAYATARIGDDALRVGLHVTQRFDPRSTPADIAVELDTDLDGEADRAAWFRWLEGDWLLAQTPSSEQTALIHAPSPRRHAHDGTADGFEVVLPRAFLPTDAGRIGWRLTARVPSLGLATTLPEAAFDTLDITPPAFVLQLAEPGAAIMAKGDGPVVLRGSVAGNATLDGGVELRLVVWTGAAPLVVPLGGIGQPAPGEWETSAELPKRLDAGSHEATLVGECRRCKAASSVRLRLTVLR